MDQSEGLSQGWRRGLLGRPAAFVFRELPDFLVDAVLEDTQAAQGRVPLGPQEYLILVGEAEGLPPGGHGFGLGIAQRLPGL